MEKIQIEPLQGSVFFFLYITADFIGGYSY
jgi:hypothetical protein